LDEAAVDVKTLHAEIGQLILENDFLEGALSKAGVPRTGSRPWGARLGCRAKAMIDREHTLGDGQGTRYRAELNVKVPGLDTLTADDVKKAIDKVVADPATVSAAPRKTVKLGMSADEVKKSLGEARRVSSREASLCYPRRHSRASSSPAPLSPVPSIPPRLAAGIMSTSILGGVGGGVSQNKTKKNYFGLSAVTSINVTVRLLPAIQSPA
jgi:hypothetical protein